MWTCEEKIKLDNNGVIIWLFLIYHNLVDVATLYILSKVNLATVYFLFLFKVNNVFKYGGQRLLFKPVHNLTQSFQNKHHHGSNKYRNCRK